MVAIDHRFLLGQSVQARRSDGKWHAAVIIDASIHNPDEFGKPPHENDTIQVIFADRTTISYNLQLDLSSFLSPIISTAELVARRKQELFQTLPPQIDEPSLPLPQDLEASQEEAIAGSSINSAPLEDPNHRMAKPRKRPFPGPELMPPPKTHKNESQRPACLDSDSDFDDETLELACKLICAGTTKEGRDAPTTHLQQQVIPPR